MKELIEKLMAAIPFFARRFVALLGGPKGTVLALDLESDSALEEAFTFLAVAFGLSFIAQMPVLAGMSGVFEKQGKEMLFAVIAVLSALSFVLNVVLVVVVWKMVGGRPAWKKIFAASCYFTGASTILFAFFFLLGTGVFKMMDPVGYKELMSGVMVDSGGFIVSAGSVVFEIFVVLGVIASYVWIVCIWGAYRELMQVSKIKSAVALILFTVLSPLLFAEQVVLMQNVMQSDKGPAMPGDLAGDWVLEEQSNAGGVPSTHSVMYSFSAPKSKMETLGSYEFKEIRGSLDGKCLITETKQELGTVQVKDPVMDLIPARRTKSRMDQCTGRASEQPQDLTTAEYNYKIDKEASGWTLCLTNRFGPTCLTPKKP